MNKININFVIINIKFSLIKFENKNKRIPLTISLIDAWEVEVHSAIGNNVSVEELRDEAPIMLTSLGVDNFSSQIASFTAAINLASSSVNSSATLQTSTCSTLIFQMILLTKLICRLIITVYLLRFQSRRFSKFITGRSAYVFAHVLATYRTICIRQKEIQKKAKLFLGLDI